MEAEPHTEENPLAPQPQPQPEPEPEPQPGAAAAPAAAPGAAPGRGEIDWSRYQVTSPAWLDQLVEHSRGEGEAIPVWAMVFKLNPQDMSPGAKLRLNRISEECRTMLEGIVEAGCEINYFFSRDEDELLVTIGAVEEILVDEATHHMDVPMQLKWWDPDTGAIDQSGKVMGGVHYFHAQHRDMFKPATETRLFHSGIQQRLVLHRIERCTRVIIAQRLAMPSRQAQLAVAKKAKKMQVFALRQLAEAYGCSNLETEVAQTVRKRLPETSKRYSEWTNTDPAKGAVMLPSVKVRIDEIAAVVAELEAREQDDQNTETDSWVTSGSLEHCYPLHFDEELNFLQERWGSLKMVIPGVCKAEDYRGIIREVVVDGEVTETYVDTTVTTWFRPHYQPIDEIRDYFGEHVALYFAWLGLYTRSLTYPMVLGCITMMGYGWFGEDSNVLALPYSFFLSLWSTVFLELWTRYENELKFRECHRNAEASAAGRSDLHGMFVRVGQRRF